MVRGEMVGAKSIPNPRASAAAFGAAQFDPDEFLQDFTTEVTQIQLQAFFGSQRVPEKPLFGNNLVPSPDGLHWDKDLDSGNFVSGTLLVSKATC